MNFLGVSWSDDLLTRVSRYAFYGGPTADIAPGAIQS